VNRDWLYSRLRSWGDREALVGDGRVTSFSGLLGDVARWGLDLERSGIGPGHVVAFDGDFSGPTVALLLGLLERGCVAVPLASAAPGQREGFLETAEAEYLIEIQEYGGVAIHPRGPRTHHPLIETLAAVGRPGLVLFSSGSTGTPKAMLHDLDRLLGKFEAPRPPLRLLTFLLPDHIGGINTLLAGLAHGGTVVTVRDRRPESVCAAIEAARVEVLPTSPTFLNLLLLSGAHRRHDLSSLRSITYGTEPMPASTLERLQAEFPGVRLQQTYGLSELGILRCQSRDDSSLWVRVGGEGYETKIVDGMLWIRARTAMLGYLNAESPFDADGWFNTHDAVEQDGDWLRFLGRTSERINVGGQKVYPAEVESVLLEMDNVLEAVVRGEPNPIVGQCVVARVRLGAPEPAAVVKARIRRYCQGRMPSFMIPVKVEVVAEPLHNARGKMVRTP
jgi:long-chain acyl-CoA synthetase